jgi:hypothetical protein
MVRGSLTVLMLLVALAGCPGGTGQLGDLCGGSDDCSSALQCVRRQCALRCTRAPDCGDGYSCDEAGQCQASTKQAGESCRSEVECAAGLSCQIDGPALDPDNHLIQTCTAENSTRAAGGECQEDVDCRNGTCALGHCVDLCLDDHDCGHEFSCTSIPRLPGGTLFSGCLPSHGVLTWPLPSDGPAPQVLLPVPIGASSAELVMSVVDDDQKVGATSVISPAGTRLYSRPCSPFDLSCDPISANDTYFGNLIRHLPAFGQAVLAIPTGSVPTLNPGVYQINVASFRSDDSPGSAIPRLTAVIRIGTGETLDLHFFFLDLSDHPCAAQTNNAPLDAAAAKTAAFFQSDYLHNKDTGLQGIFRAAALEISEEATYDDIKDHPELDGLDVADAGALFKLGKYKTGINVFFVRSLSPIGLQAFGPNPGPAGLGGTSQSGIVIGLDTLCYRKWADLARLTAHELARYMGLYHNVELETPQHGLWRDQIEDDDAGDPITNLMFFSESGSSDVRAGPVLSAEQRELLTRSAVLQ